MSGKSLSFSIDSRDIRFSLFDVFEIQQLLTYEKFKHQDREQLETILTEAERMAVEVISPLNRVADENHPTYENGKVTMPPEFYPAFRKFCDAGWHSCVLEKEAFGMGLPEGINMAVREFFNGACGGFYAFSSLTTGALHLIESFGSEALKETYIEKMAKGIYTGTMCLTEPEAGSYLADMTTKAVRDGDVFRIKGTKIFIGTGDHDLSENIIHCVMARIEGAPAGYRGISLFAVPKYKVNPDGTLGPSNDVICGGIENKMGWDGAPTAVLHFGSENTCQGWLLGEEGQGLALMFQMMNEMRLSTAVQGIGQAAAAYQKVLSYTKHRYQGLSHKRKKGDPPDQVTIINHPDIRRNLLFMKTVVEGCRRLIFQTAIYIDLANLHADERMREHYADLVEILTPICKAYATDMGLRAADTAIQSMGGYGYIKESGVEQYLRDLKVACIYEGTNGIQAITLQRRGLRLKKGKLFQNLISEIDSFIGQHREHSLFGSLAGRLDEAKIKVAAAAASFSDSGEEDPGLPLSVAKPFLDMCGHVLCTWMLLKSAVVADSFLKDGSISERDREFFQGKVYTAQFAVANLLPEVNAIAVTIAARDRSVIDIGEESF
jgi:alkylation response protein AidB-like acyl-CoA dehydrogenase